MSDLSELKKQKAQIKRAMKRTHSKGYYQDLEMCLDSIESEISLKTYMATSQEVKQ